MKWSTRRPAGSRVGLLAGLLLALLTAGCARQAAAPMPAPSATTTPPAFITAPATAAIPQLIAAERSAARAGDLALLAQLWAADARIVDGRDTPTADDDFVWQGRPAILDRYRLAVFPAPPPALDSLPAAAITEQGGEARVTLGRDRWVFRQEDGRWWIEELRY